MSKLINGLMVEGWCRYPLCKCAYVKSEVRKGEPTRPKKAKRTKK